MVAMAIIQVMLELYNWKDSWVQVGSDIDGEASVWIIVDQYH